MSPFLFACGPGHSYASWDINVTLTDYRGRKRSQRESVIQSPVTFCRMSQACLLSAEEWKREVWGLITGWPWQFLTSGFR